MAKAELIPKDRLCRALIVIAVLVSGSVTLCSASASGFALTWSAPHSIDTSGRLTSVSCVASTEWCAATDSAGSVLTSEDAASRSPSWSGIPVDSGVYLTAISCPSASFCAATDSAGNVLVSEDPRAGAGAWASLAIDSGNELTAISCPSNEFCSAADDAGDLISTPTPQSTWWSGTIDLGQSISGLSCPSASRCVASDETGNALVVDTSTPTTSVSWFAVEADPGLALAAISCPSSLTCIGVDDDGGAVGSDEVVSSPTWSRVGIDGSSSLSSISCATISECVAVGADGSEVTGSLQPPVNTGLPTISGNAEGGSTLSEVHGLWTGGPTNYEYRWLRCDPSGESCEASNDTTDSYEVSGADVGHTLRVQEAAANEAGYGAAALSAATATVPAPNTGPIGGEPRPTGEESEYPMQITIPNPAQNIPIGALPVSCSSPSSAPCENAVIYYLDKARATLGVGPYDLPSDFLTLAPIDQIFILADLDRIAYAVPPVPGLTAALDAAAAEGVQRDDDPAAPAVSAQAFGYSSNWAGAFENDLAAYYDWLYDDGYGSSNLDCKTPSASGCWGHRQDVYAFDVAKGTAMGAAVGLDPSGMAGYTMLVAWSIPAIDDPFVYTWSQAVAEGAGTNPYDPGVPALSGTEAFKAQSGATGAPHAAVRLTASLRVRRALHRVLVTFHISTPKLSFICVLRRGGRRLKRGHCTSPKAYSRLGAGRYSVQIEAWQADELVATRTLRFRMGG